jgi:hypothetical protein
MKKVESFSTRRIRGLSRFVDGLLHDRPGETNSCLPALGLSASSPTTVVQTAATKKWSPMRLWETREIACHCQSDRGIPRRKRLQSIEKTINDVKSRASDMRLCANAPFGGNCDRKKHRVRHWRGSPDLCDFWLPRADLPGLYLCVSFLRRLTNGAKKESKGA